MTFAEIGYLVGGLPSSAYLYPAWWANDDPTHSHARAWSGPGFHAHADLVHQTVVFSRVRERQHQ